MVEPWATATIARVCVVDDDPTALAAVARALQPEFDVVAARSGGDALRLIGRHPPDLVLLDVEMPELDGFSVCERLKDDPLTEHIPVVFLTSHTDEATELRGLAAGAADFIAKPPRGPVVLARVRNLVRLKRMAERLRIESQTDGLTGLLNRGQFDRMLGQEVLRAQRQQRPLSLVMVDVDHFKAYNDRYGHLAGDGALRQVAQALKTVSRRAGDLACRYGGEEFALLLPDTDAAGAAAIAEALMLAVADLRLPHASSPTSPWVTLSVGCAHVDPPAMPPDGPRDGPREASRETPRDGPRDGDALARRLIVHADAALYAAKRHGRHQAWSHPPEGPRHHADGPAPTGLQPAVVAAIADATDV